MSTKKSIYEWNLLYNQYGHYLIPEILTIKESQLENDTQPGNHTVCA